MSGLHVVYFIDSIESSFSRYFPIGAFTNEATAEEMAKIAWGKLKDKWRKTVADEGDDIDRYDGEMDWTLHGFEKIQVCVDQVDNVEQLRGFSKAMGWSDVKMDEADFSGL